VRGQGRGRPTPTNGPFPLQTDGVANHLKGGGVTDHRGWARGGGTRQSPRVPAGCLIGSAGGASSPGALGGVLRRMLAVARKRERTAPARHVVASPRLEGCWGGRGEGDVLLVALLERSMKSFGAIGSEGDCILYRQSFLMKPHPPTCIHSFVFNMLTCIAYLDTTHWTVHFRAAPSGLLPLNLGFFPPKGFFNFGQL